jgi:hypothetical protein
MAYDGDMGVPSTFSAKDTSSIFCCTGKRVVDIAFAGGLAREDHIYKALARCSLYENGLYGRAVMNPGFLGQTYKVLSLKEKDGKWKWVDLPSSVKRSAKQQMKSLPGTKMFKKGRRKGDEEYPLWR